MRRKLRVLFAASEAEPFIKTGGLGDVGGSLPKALKKAGCEVRVILPKFGTIAERYTEKMTHLTDFRLQLAWRDLYCGIEKLVEDGITYYFIDNEYYFKREKPYGYGDDAERMAFFSKAICESLKYLPDFKCDILHLNDWHTASAAVFLRECYQGDPLYENVKTVFTVHNLKFQGQYANYILGDILGLHEVPAAASQLCCDDGSVNYMKGALLYSDILTTVSPTYAQEVKTDFFGEKLDWIFRDRESVLYGILNGIDTDKYDPETDTALPQNFSASDFSGKANCKAELQKELGLEQNPNVPLAVMIGRLTDQKGLDLVAHVIDEMLEDDLQIAILGTGDKVYEKLFADCAERHPGKCAARIMFDAALSQRMYSAADMLIMPSLFEPCGLAQMIAMSYGTLPIVRETGGLKDSVKAYNRYTGEGTGFSFANYNAHEMKDTVLSAAALFREDKAAWTKLMQNAMAEDFSWDRSAEDYCKIYQSLHPEVTPWKKSAKK